jgi:hypothetical protein
VIAAVASLSAGKVILPTLKTGTRNAEMAENGNGGGDYCDQESDRRRER